MKKPLPTVKKKNIFRRLLDYLKGKWNSMLYWLMFKKKKCIIPGCNCKS